MLGERESKRSLLTPSLCLGGAAFVNLYSIYTLLLLWPHIRVSVQTRGVFWPFYATSTGMLVSGLFTDSHRSQEMRMSSLLL